MSSLPELRTVSSPTRGPWQLAVFDLDGTLVDTQQDLLDCLAEALKGEGFDQRARLRARGALHLGMQAMIFAALGEGDRDGQKIQRLLARYLEIYAERIAHLSKPYAGVSETLDWLSQRGVSLAVCSNKTSNMSRLLLDKLGLLRWFPVIVGPDTTGWPKPHPEPLRHAAWESGVSRSRAVLIGDSVIDLRCAQATSMPCWMFLGGYDRETALKAPLRFERFSELCVPAYWGDKAKRPRSVL